MKWLALGCGIGLGLPIGLFVMIEGFNRISSAICGSLVNPEV